jgi:hypothetical protein
MSALLRLYPGAWRERYGPEFEVLLAERPPSWRDVLDIVVSAIDARVSPQLTGAPGIATPWSSRLSGASAILGGLGWCVVILVAGLVRSDEDYTLPVFAAVGLMLLSLPGRYMRRYARSIALGVGAASGGLAALDAEILPWGEWLVIPIALILGALGPGAFALAAVRAGFGAAARWRLLALVIPLPIIGVLVLAIGLVPEGITGPLLVASLMPLGVAWMFTGARIAAGRSSTSVTTAGGLA